PLNRELGPGACQPALGWLAEPPLPRPCAPERRFSRFSRGRRELQRSGERHPRALPRGIRIAVSNQWRRAAAGQIAAEGQSLSGGRECGTVFRLLVQESPPE